MSTPGRLARWLVSRPGGRSLHRQLFIWLLLPQIVLWIAAASFTYRLASGYANKAIDASLSQASRALARQVKPQDNGLLIDFPRAAQDILESDPADRVLYTVSTPPGQFILGNKNLPPVPASLSRPQIGETYFYDGVLRETAPYGSERRAPVRVAALFLNYGDEDTGSQTMLVQVARSSANREDLATQILQDMVLPLSGLIALMTMIVWAGIRAGLAPLQQLQRDVEGRAANDLAPIRLEAAPPEVRALAGAINTLLAEVSHNVVAQKRFIGDAAHQLRTPLAGLKSQAELALREAGDEAPRLSARLRLVHEGAARSAHLVNQLLTLARAEPESAFRHDRVPVDLRRLARELTVELVPRALQSGVDLGFDQGEEERLQGGAACAGPEVRGIALLLREALANLVDNAIRYAGSGATVTVRVRQQARQVLLEVEDNGPGLPESEREHVFERFVRATHDGNGCGLGLAIVREIVERHAGSVVLLPVAPHGLLAQVRLPHADQG